MDSHLARLLCLLSAKNGHSGLAARPVNSLEADIAVRVAAEQITEMVSAPDYERLKSWFAFVIEQPAMGFGEIPAAVHPLKFLSQLEQMSASKARRELKIAIGDVVEMSSDMRGSDVQLIDESCRARGLPTLSEVRSRFSKSINAIVRRGEIRSEAEYYLVRSAVEFIVNEKDQAVLLGLLSRFEAERPKG